MSPPTKNEAQIEYWNEVAGPKWVAMQEILDGQIETLGLAMLDRAAIAPGERVLDVGCGCGGTTLEITRRVGPYGRVAGLDLSAPMLARARERAAAAGLTALEFIQGDAQTMTFETRAFDAAVSRFGVMFFDDPAAAFTNLSAALKPGGRLAFICWRALHENPWMMLPLAAVAPIIELPPPPAPDEPGPFSFADEARLRRILEDAGYARIAIDAHDQDMTIGADADLDRAIDFIFQIGPLARVLADASNDQRQQAHDALRDTFAPHHSERGVVLASAAWIVTARSD